MTNKSLNLKGISKDMRKLDTWCCADGKIPCNLDGKYFKGMKTADFPLYSLEEVSNNTKNLGISFQLRGDIFCIDLDHCFEKPFDTEPKEWAKLIIDFAIEQKVTIEYSMSGTGLHIFMKTSKKHYGFQTIKVKLNKIHKKFEDLKNDGIDIMQNNMTICVTGNIYKNKLTEKMCMSNTFDKFLADIRMLSTKDAKVIKKEFEKNQTDKTVKKDKKYFNNTFDYVKSQVSIEEITNYYKLEIKNNKALCPFHTENTPSLTIDTASNLWYCFGCGKGGSIIDFVMLKENIDSFSALKRILDISKLDIELGFDNAMEINGIVYRLPEKYYNTTSGFTVIIEKKDREGNINYETILLQNEQFIILGEYYNNNNKEKGIMILHDNKKIGISITELSTKNKIISALASKGIKCTDLNFQYYIDYIHKFRNLNDQVWEIIDFTDTLGWLKEKQGKFAPYDENIHLSEGIEDLITTKGSFEDWKKQIIPLRENDFFNFVMSSYVFSPLLEPLKRRMIGIAHIGSSRLGKTALAKACMSIWGDPNKLEISGNSSILALEFKASIYNNIPMYFDEKISNTTGKDSAQEFSRMVYGLFNSVQGDKLHPDGTLRTRYSWNNLIHFTAEMPIKRDNMNKGAHTRLMEFTNVKGFNNKKDSENVYQWTQKYYGHGDKIIKTIKEIGYENLVDMLEKNKINNVNKVPDHIWAIENAAIGDYILNKMLGLEANIEESFKRMEKIIPLLIDEKDTQTGNKAIDVVSNYLMMNRKSIEGLDYNKQIFDSAECTGKIFNDCVGISKMVLKKELTNTGFDADKVFQDWKIDGLCKEERKTINGSRPLVLVFKNNFVDINQNIEEEETKPFDDDNVLKMKQRVITDYKRMTLKEQKDLLAQLTTITESKEEEQLKANRGEDYHNMIKENETKNNANNVTFKVLDKTNKSSINNIKIDLNTVDKNQARNLFFDENYRLTIPDFKDMYVKTQAKQFLNDLKLKIHTAYREVVAYIKDNNILINSC
jgi:uncharacterized protein (DUF927 family)